nr:DUF1501 domain-containing protein [Angustibacter aerolatus]
MAAPARSTLAAVGKTFEPEERGLHPGERRVVLDVQHAGQGAARRRPAHQGRRRPAGRRDRHRRLGHARRPRVAGQRLDARQAVRPRDLARVVRPRHGPDRPDEGHRGHALGVRPPRRRERLGGLDHGHGNAVLMLGGGVAGGQVHGRWPGLGKDQARRRRPRRHHQPTARCSARSCRSAAARARSARSSPGSANPPSASPAAPDPRTPFPPLVPLCAPQPAFRPRRAGRAAESGLGRGRVPGCGPRLRAHGHQAGA